MTSCSFAEGPLQAQRYPNTHSYNQQQISSPTKSVSSSSSYQSSGKQWIRNRSTTSSNTDFDDLYDVSEGEADFIPIKLSNSMKKSLAIGVPKHKGLPSLVIPSPSLWPTVQKLQNSVTSGSTLSSLGKTPLSARQLSKLTTTMLEPIERSITPSSPGSLTADDHTEGCSSPEQSEVESIRALDMPIQLHPAAMDTLHHISDGSPQDFDQMFDSIGQHGNEMQERGLNISVVVSPGCPYEDYEPLTAISLPSPGAFFGSSGPNASRTWVPGSPHDVPSTSTAESFYDIPWRRRLVEPMERISEATESNAHSSRASTAYSLISNGIVEPANDQDGLYEDKLREDASTNLRRTTLWLSAQQTYLSALKSPDSTNDYAQDCETPKQAVADNSSSSAKDSSPGKKSVRFTEDTVEVGSSTQVLKPPADSEDLFYEAFQHLSGVAEARDSFVHRHARADAIQTQRTHFTGAHKSQLMGKFAIEKHQRPSRDMSHLPTAPDAKGMEARRVAIAQAENERQALQQIGTSYWDLEATKFLAGGSFLPGSVSTALSAARQTGTEPRILDLGGQPVAGWGWAVAMEHPGTQVITAVPASAPCADESEWCQHSGPSNHLNVSVPNAWTLPFPDNHFDFISARSMHSLLRLCDASSTPFTPSTTFSPSAFKTSFDPDEYDATLAEIKRVLVPGGVFQFSLLDADIAGDKTSALVAKSTEFAVALRSRGYDPSASRHFVSRVTSAGFEDVTRTWMRLPLGKVQQKKERPTSMDSIAAEGWGDWRGAAFPHLIKPYVDSSRSSTSDDANAMSGRAFRAVSPWRPGGGLRIDTGCQDSGYATDDNSNGPRPSTDKTSLSRGTNNRRRHSRQLSNDKAKEVSTSLEADLPGQGVEAVTGLVGSLAWERWMLKLQTELGKDEDELLQGVATAIEQARKADMEASWTMLMGCARKAL